MGLLGFIYILKTGKILQPPVCGMSTDIGVKRKNMSSCKICYVGDVYRAKNARLIVHTIVNASENFSNICHMIKYL